MGVGPQPQLSRQLAQDWGGQAPLPVDIGCCPCAVSFDNHMVTSQLRQELLECQEHCSQFQDICMPGLPFLSPTAVDPTAFVDHTPAILGYVWVYQLAIDHWSKRIAQAFIGRDSPPAESPIEASGHRHLDLVRSLRTQAHAPQAPLDRSHVQEDKRDYLHHGRHQAH